MTTIHAIAPGILARSESLVQTTRDHDRERATDDELREAQRSDTEDLLGIQAAHGITPATPGLVTWQDHLRPFTEIVPQLSPGPLTRFLDTNTFYRRPELDGTPTLDTTQLTPALDTHLPRTGTLPGLATLPAPTTVVTGASDEEARYPDPELATTFATNVLAPILEGLPARGYTTAVLTDPWLTHHPDPATLLKATGELIQAAPAELTLLTWLPFQNAAPITAPLAELGADGVIVDLTLTDRDALAPLAETGALGIGLVDVRTSLVERPDLIAATATTIAQELDPSALYLAPTGDLQHVPAKIQRAKLRALGEATDITRAKLGGDPR